jgi:hypothetical protein
MTIRRTSRDVALFLTLVGLAGAAFSQIDQKKTKEQQIEEALSALPQSMRDDAAVKGYDDAGNLIELKAGESQIVCRADDPAVRAWVVVCYPKSLEAFVSRSQELTKSGAETPARIKTLGDEIRSGKIAMPAIGALYTRTGNTVDDATGVIILHVPNATAASTGLPTLPTPGSPWLSDAGTPMAQIRIAVP